MSWQDKTVIYVDMDRTLCDFDGAYRYYQCERPDVAFPQSIPGFYAGLQPLPHAVETYRWLHEQEAFAVFVLTAPSTMNPHCYTEKRLWVEQHLGFDVVDRLIISAHKGLNRGHYLIDDNAEGRGQEYFEGELIHFGQTPFPDWLEVRRFFERLSAGAEVGA
ncbi:5' nucleotidase, NT5C type [Microbulbifer magnicolonia]|uniref:5' nucleotidase, NT5C type n=1 Tax=Microbulbifer magnicolonia TaxID=3109744 RepID=UPI002B410EAE|nr:hypothetical protein [Microbulbifer sp. GG15]